MGSAALALFLCLNLILFTYTCAVTTCNNYNCQNKEGGECSKECGGGKQEGGCGEQEGGKGQGQGGSKGRQQGSSKGCEKEGGKGQQQGGGGGGKGAVGDTCPLDALKLGVCADLLRDLLKIQIGEPPVQPCCSLIENLVDAEADLCLCNAIKAVSVAGIKLNVPLSLSLLLNACGRTPPAGFLCPPS